MIDLTPLDVRNKRGDFRKSMRGYEIQDVDSFLEMVAERLEALVRENLQLKERTQSLESQVRSQTERESAVRDALVTAQELRTEIREQARVEAEKVVEDARTESRRMIAEAEAEVRIRLRNSERKADEIVRSLGELERGRLRFLRSFRQLLEREMDVVEVEEARTPLEDRSYEMDLGAIRAAVDREEAERAPDAAPTGDPIADENASEEDAPEGEEGEDRGQEPLDAPRRNEHLLMYLDEEEAEDERD
jgi:cell division initiation protein